MQVLNRCVNINNQLNFPILINIKTLFVRQLSTKGVVGPGNTKTFYKMHEAYIRYTSGTEVFDFTFRFSRPDLNIDKQLNFSRKVSENVETFLHRVSSNVIKQMTTKAKRKAKKAKVAPGEEEIKVDHVKEGNIYLSKGDNKINLDEPCSNFLTDPSELKLVVFDQKYDVKLNAPWIIKMKLPSCLLANFPVYPSEFESMYVDRGLSVFTWHKSVYDEKMKLSWKFIGEGFLYKPSAEDIGSKLKLKCLPRNDRLEGSETEVDSDTLVEAGPGECPFETRHKFTSNKLSGDSFRVTSYNLLADTYADSEYSRAVLFPYCPPYALNIDYRKLLIIKELIGYNSDIMCLQEVDKKIYDNDFLPSLSSVNFDGVFNAKGTTSEGQATLYDTKRFEMLSYKGISMADGIEKNLIFKKTWDKITNENARVRFKDRSTSVLIVTLRSRDNPKEILVVGNTHLYFHPDADHIRLLQAYFALTSCQATADEIRQQYPEHNVTIMLCGDFNSTPVDGVYEFITKNAIPETHKDWTSNSEQIVENVSISHDLALKSACGTPEYTNFTVEFADCLDYIFYETNKLEVSQVIPMPSKEELLLNQAIPSVVFPSDHIAICADLKWHSPSSSVS
ncbi:2',5'-phosphodiesterase 12 isoform X1 [Cotesia glomerata]|uniref:2',5'-phosphodiesterase 12 n=1 Tax=Cotesia glomerata TaxID=32391 RepID=A0AAV7J293_COTGL|nr:2',5'-phosphodiesterase 12 isoform X1 [Cotesia glomerata]KAH0563970.1 hypothetical protein KQX54_008435 [Cotesia glomerata]